MWWLMVGLGFLLPSLQQRWISWKLIVYEKKSPKWELTWVVVSNSFYVHPYLGKIPILSNIFRKGLKPWNHQLVTDRLLLLTDLIFFTSVHLLLVQLVFFLLIQSHIVNHHWTHHHFGEDVCHVCPTILNLNISISHDFPPQVSDGFVAGWFFGYQEGEECDALGCQAEEVFAHHGHSGWPGR